MNSLIIVASVGTPPCADLGGAKSSRRGTSNNATAAEFGTLATTPSPNRYIIFSLAAQKPVCDN